MPVLVLLLVFAILGGLIWYAIELYTLTAAYGGPLLGIASLILAAIVLALPFVYWARRYVRIHGRKQQGKRILQGTYAWGQVQLDALHKRGQIDMASGEGRGFIFADIVSVDTADHALTVNLQHPEQAWTLSFESRNELKRWKTIFTLAARQEL